MLTIAREHLVAVPYAAAEAGFSDEESLWLPEPADYIGEATWNTYVWACGFGVHVLCQVGAPQHRDEGVWRRVSWVADVSAIEDLAPRFDGEVAVLPADDGTTVLRIQGRYRPPWSIVGALLARLGLHRLAEHTVTVFLRDVADRLTILATDRAPR